MYDFSKTKCKKYRINYNYETFYGGKKEAKLRENVRFLQNFKFKLYLNCVLKEFYRCFIKFYA